MPKKKSKVAKKAPSKGIGRQKKSKGALKGSDLIKKIKNPEESRKLKSAKKSLRISETKAEILEPEIRETKPAVQVEEEVIDVTAVGKPKSSRLPVTKSSTLISTDPLLTYLSEIRNYPLLTPEQERELALRYKETGDAKAAEELVTSNLRFVVKIAAEYSKFGAKMIDLIQEGNVGLMHAVREFNPYKGVRLITYAVWWIRGYIRDYLLKQYSVVRMGTTHNQRKLFYNLQQEEKKLEAMGKDLDVPLLSSRLGISEKEIYDMKQRLKGRDISLDQPIDDDSKSRLLDLQTSENDLSPEDLLSHREQVGILKEKINQIRPTLKEKEIMILESRILADEPLTLQEIGDKLGITRERARQLEARIISKIKSALDSTLNAVEESTSKSKS